MDLQGKVVVVTGGGGGIGAAMGRAFAAGGARAIAVADIDGAAAERVAGELAKEGPATLAAQVDAGDTAAVEALVDRVEDELGPIDLFCANAGIFVLGGIETPDDEWDRIWHVNVKGHVAAARAVVPRMLARGGGYFLSTASAAGLLTQIGSAPYSVTKHAAVGFAEWLSITHGDAGLRVSCLCPQAVDTAMLRGGLTGEAGEQAAEASSAARDGVLPAEVVAEAVVAGLADERFLILPHAEVAEYERRRAGDRERWLKGMRRLQALLFGGPQPPG